ncbi:Ger(x)C family spore germination protein [Paenibacillus harenae]|uniref:Ger(x)C family spore germination protein n=1 Tax=Paenibacillus harenae TaxID=306543 RepID=UPI000425B546|nr:Ger(x)C family spore germination protein [Paenibacillus harenae]
MTLSRIWVGCLTLIACLGFLTGCWDRTEMDDLALVMASGLDLSEDGRVEITLQIALPTGIPSALQSGGKAAKPVLVVSAKGKDSIDALDRLQQQLSRRINLGHRGIIVVGEKYARRGFDQVLDTLLRSPESRYNSYIVTAYGTTAKKILEAPYLMEIIPSIGINKLQYSDFSLSVKTDKFIDALASFGKSPVTGAIKIMKQGAGQQTYIIDKAAVYKRNKLVGFLSGKELKAFRLVAGRSRDMKLTTQMEPPKKEYKGTVTIRLLKATPKIRTEIKNGNPEVSVSLNALGSILSNDTSMDMSKVIPLVEKKFAADLQEEITKTISHTQKKFKSDIFGFGNRIHIEHPYAWKKMKEDWDELYPKASVQVKTVMVLERVGRTQAPAHQQKK